MRPLTAARSLFACAVLIATQAQAQTDDVLANIAAQLDKHAVVRAEFTQSTQVNGLKRPLQTRGHMLFARQYGVFWQIDKPYRMSYALGENKVVEIAADGSRKERTVRDLPGLAQIGRVFRAMLGANVAALRNYFDVQVQGSSSHWALALTPKQAQMAQFIEHLEIDGGTFVDAIRIQEQSGGLTQINFRNSTGSDALTESEQRLFADAPGQ